MDRLYSKGATIITDYPLCGWIGESINHLFYQCDFSHWVSRDAIKVVGGLVKPSPNPKFESICDLLARISMGMREWGLGWTILGVVSWALWKE